MKRLKVTRVHGPSIPGSWKSGMMLDKAGFAMSAVSLQAPTQLTTGFVTLSSNSIVPISFEIKKAVRFSVGFF